jgi:hypothetical protein
VTRRARAHPWGAAVCVLYCASAIVSGPHIPVARRPILDGIAPPTAYRWVTPPPELAGTNMPPETASASVALDANGNGTKVITSGDAQVTLILPKGAIAPSPGQTGVDVTIEPIDPATLGPPPAQLEVAGNAYLVSGTYQPSGDAVTGLVVPAELVLVYPVLPNDHGGHTLIVSAKGKRWDTVETNDLVSVAQADGPVPAFGYAAVAKAPSAATATHSATSSGGSESFPVTIVIVGLAVLVLIAGVVLGGRNARQRRANARRRTSSKQRRPPSRR